MRRSLPALARARTRGSYLQWLEDDLPPQVVFEVLSPSNTDDELDAKLAFYDRYGVEEYYVIDPYEQAVEGYVRRGAHLGRIRKMLGFTSPRLGCRFEKRDAALVILTPDGRPFQSRRERVEGLTAEVRTQTKLAAEDRKRARAEMQRADAALLAKERLAAKLRELGVDPDAE
jgi:hypothetical protein